jgi:hypothetical protein
MFFIIYIYVYLHTMSEDFQMYIIIGLAFFILAFMWSVVGRQKTVSPRQKTVPPRQKTPFEKRFNPKDAEARIRRRMGPGIKYL